jgi:hypothetical protein
MFLERQSYQLVLQMFGRWQRFRIEEQYASGLTVAWVNICGMLGLLECPEELICWELRDVYNSSLMQGVVL